MSAPPSGSSGSSPSPSTPAPGYYPDPSIPNYIRYWNGSAWVPGTSRPAPVDATPENPAGGAPAPAPASPWPAADGSGGLAGPAPGRPGGRAVDESGPMFLDEDPRAPRAEPGPAELPAQPGSGQAGPGQAAAGQAGPGQFGPGHVDPGQSGAAQAGPGQ